MATYQDFNANFVTQLDDSWLRYRLGLNRPGLKAVERPVDVPDVELCVGIYGEFMGNVMTRYNGTLGLNGPSVTRPPSELWQVSPKYTDQMKPYMLASSGIYYGEGVVPV
jgi:hypothetical protein